MSQYPLHIKMPKGTADTHNHLRFDLHSNDIHSSFPHMECKHVLHCFDLHWSCNHGNANISL